jgi:hypothetical protein
LATDNQPARSPYGRAGFKPRHKPTALSLPTACAASPVQSPPCESGSTFEPHASSLQKAKKSLTATFANSEIELTYSQRKTYQNSNRNKNGFSPFDSGPGREGIHPLQKPIANAPTSSCAASPAQSPPYGVNPRHKLTRLSLPTACAGSVAQSSPCAARSSLQQAIKRPARQSSGGLIATVPKSKIELTYSRHAIYENPNRNSFAVFQHAPSVGQPPPRHNAGGTIEKGKPNSAEGGDRMAA